MGLLGDLSRQLFGGSKTKERRGSSSKLDPRLMDAFLRNLDCARSVADSRGVRRFAGLTLGYTAGAGAIRGVGGRSSVMC